MRFFLKLFTVPLLSLLVNHTQVSAQPTTARFLLLRPSAVSMSMGGTGVALEHSPFAAYVNAAALAFLPTINVAGSYAEPLPFFDNIRQSYFTGSFSFPNFGTFAVSANLYWKGTQFVTNETGLGILSTENIMDWHLKLSYAHAFSENFSAGIGVGVLNLNLGEVGAGNSMSPSRSTTMLLDAGIMYRNLLPSATFLRGQEDSGDPFASLADQYSPTGLSLGLAFANVGPKITMVDDQQADPPPGTFTLGLAYSPIRTTPIGFMVAIDAEKELYDASAINYMHWGGELTVFRLFALRGGYFMDASGPRTSYWTWGAGLRLRFLHLNVARYTRAILPSWHFDGAFIWEL